MIPVKWDRTFGERSIHQESKRLHKDISTNLEETNTNVVETC